MSSRPAKYAGQDQSSVWATRYRGCQRKAEILYLFDVHKLDFNVCACKSTKKIPHTQEVVGFFCKKKEHSLGSAPISQNMPRYEMAIWRPVLPSSRLIFGRSMVKIPSSTFALIFDSSTLSGKVYFCSKFVYANSRLR